MRKIIPFIASNFRKDKIWLRRTKKSKRECEVLVAVDNSKSMADNDVRRMAFLAMATVCQSLSVLEIGRLGVLKFGENCQVVQGWDSPNIKKTNKKTPFKKTYENVF
jgi:midasin